MITHPHICTHMLSYSLILAIICTQSHVSSHIHSIYILTVHSHTFNPILCTHAHTHLLKCTKSPTPSHMLSHSPICSHTHPYTLTHILSPHTHMHTLICTHMHSLTQARNHASTQLLTHSLTHSYALICTHHLHMHSVSHMLSLTYVLSHSPIYTHSLTHLPFCSHAYSRFRSVLDRPPRSCSTTTRARCWRTAASLPW